MRVQRLVAPIFAAAFFTFLSGICASRSADAGFFTNSSGLVNPAQTIDFNSFNLSNDEVVTNQAAALGVTFSPFVYYNPEGGFFPNGRVGNFSDSGVAFVNPVTLSFSGLFTAAAFQMAADTTPYSFDALLGNSVVDSGTTTVDDSGQFFGFTGVTFNAIEISQVSAGGGPYWLIGNLQFGPSLVSVPEPGSFALLGTGIIALGLLIRKRQRHG